MPNPTENLANSIPSEPGEQTNEERALYHVPPTNEHNQIPSDCGMVHGDQHVLRTENESTYTPHGQVFSTFMENINIHNKRKEAAVPHLQHAQNATDRPASELAASMRFPCNLSEDPTHTRSVLADRHTLAAPVLGEIC